MAPALFVCAALAISLPQEAAKPTETVIRLTVQPMAVPKPALRYQLLPELREMQPGNPILAYLRCFPEQQNFFFNQKVLEERERLQTMPLAELRQKGMRNYGTSLLRRVDEAARFDTPDWQILQKAKVDGMRLLLPEIQQLRSLEAALKVRFRAEIAEGRFEEALVTAKTQFALARHLGEHPTLIGGLVGVAIAHATVGPLEEMLQQPGCPNLYWALTELPHPLIDLRKGMQGEKLLLDAEFALLDATAPMPEQRIKQALDRLTEMHKHLETPVQDIRAFLHNRAKDETHVRAARQRLVESGLAAELVQSFPALQVVLLDEKLTFDIQRDEWKKWTMIPYWQAEPHLLAAIKSTGEGFQKWGVAPVKVRKAHARLEQRIALLRHVEALRLYAAAHDGKLPAQLSDIPLPLPVDPFTGKPFLYKVEGNTAELRGTPPQGEEANASYNLRYLVTIQK
jgi:hypothetical protein